jgi:hypothetical protein
MISCNTEGASRAGHKPPPARAGRGGFEGMPSGREGIVSPMCPEYGGTVLSISQEGDTPIVPHQVSDTMTRSRIEAGIPRALRWLSLFGSALIAEK